jgi:type IV pilus assembly protein PilC
MSSFQSVPAVEKIFFTQYLHVMIRAGFSIARALNTLTQQTTNKYFKKVIGEIRADVESGMAFSKSLGKHPKVFNELYVNMVAAGESSGKLDEVLSTLAMKMKKDHGLLSKVKGALTYPIIILVIMLGVAILMAVVVIPQLSGIFSENGAQMPVMTRILMWVSGFLIHQGLYVVIGVIILVVLVMRLLRTKKGKHLFDTVILKSPIAGTIVKKVNLARFTRSLSSMLETNIPIIETFMIISRTMGNTFYKSAFEETAQRLRTGNTISHNLESYPALFPPLTTQMISIGEESGSLDSISAELATFYEEEVDQTMSNLSTIIEPILMLLLGVGVALMAVAIILPIYSLSEQIG